MKLDRAPKLRPLERHHLEAHADFAELVSHHRCDFFLLGRCRRHDQMNRERLTILIAHAVAVGVDDPRAVEIARGLRQIETRRFDICHRGMLGRQRSERHRNVARFDFALQLRARNGETDRATHERIG